MNPETRAERPEAAVDAAPESAKRRQILDGARRTFLGQGFGAASMGEIAREAGVSKGTLYVYFDSKEALFAALVAESKREAAERMLELDHEDPDVRAALLEFARRLLRKIALPNHVALVRMVIGAAEKFPELARVFFEAGPAHGARCLTGYLAAQAARGRLAVPDPELAAWQFLGMCNQPILIGVVFAAQDAPDDARIEEIAQSAVATFLAAYAPG